MLACYPPMQLERVLGVPVSHETHRGRALFNPFITAHLLNRFPDLYITADWSHWTVVCERLFTHSVYDEEVCMSGVRGMHRLNPLPVPVGWSLPCSASSFRTQFLMRRYVCPADVWWAGCVASSLFACTVGLPLSCSVYF